MQEIIENCKELDEIAKMSLQKYERGKIYKIHPADSDLPCYIGSSTSKYLAARLRQHRGHYKMFKNKKFSYISSFDVLEKGNAVITLIENYPCLSKDELVARERYWQERIDCVNRKKAHTTLEEKKCYLREYKKRQCVCDVCGETMSQGWKSMHKKRHLGSDSASEV